MVEADEEGGDIDGGWVDTHHYESKEKKDGGEAALDMDEPAPKDIQPPPPVVQTQEDSDEEALDMEDFEESGMMDDQVINDSLKSELLKKCNVQCFFSGFFRRFRRLTRRNSELDENFGLVRQKLFELD